MNWMRANYNDKDLIYTFKLEPMPEVCNYLVDTALRLGIQVPELIVCCDFDDYKNYLGLAIPEYFDEPFIVLYSAKKLSVFEIADVLAHELGHIKHFQEGVCITETNRKELEDLAEENKSKLVTEFNRTQRKYRL